MSTPIDEPPAATDLRAETDANLAELAAMSPRHADMAAMLREVIADAEVAEATGAVPIGHSRRAHDARIAELNTLASALLRNVENDVVKPT